MAEVKIDLPIDIAPQEAQWLLAMKLYETGRVSLGKAAEMAGLSLRTFMELLGKYGVPVFNSTPSELEAEMDL